MTLNILNWIEQIKHIEILNCLNAHFPLNGRNPKPGPSGNFYILNILVPLTGLSPSRADFALSGLSPSQADFPLTGLSP